MAMPLESEIMREIGLGQHYSWYNGSGSCPEVRRHAVRLLPEVIQRRHDAGDRIAAPIGALIALVREAGEYLDKSAYSLTKTWQVASDVIQAHIAAGASAGTEHEMTMPNACADYWAPQIREAAERIDMMGFYAEDYLRGGGGPSIITDRRGKKKL